MKVFSVKPVTFGNKNQYNKIQSNQSFNKVEKNKKEIVAAAIGASSIIAGIVIYKNLKSTNKKIEKCIDNVITKGSSLDNEYRKSILKALNLPESKLDSIQSILGEQEFKSTITKFSALPKAYTPGNSLITKTQDEYILDGVKNKTFRISLHNHTTHSDGKMNIKELLEQAANYADEVYNHNKNNTKVVAQEAPFTIAITDHDTVEGCKEVVKIISNNPEKYKNLRVVLGSELSVECTYLGSEQKKPVSVHLVLNCINPFDENLNNFLDKIKTNRKKLAEKFFDDFKQEISETLDKKVAEKFSLKEAQEEHKVLKDGLNYPWYYLKSYVKSKLDPSEEKQIMTIFSKIQKKYEPKMELQDYCINMEDLINLIKKQPSGYMTIAHPALYPIGECITNGAEAHNKLTALISNFKIKGGEKALAVEVYYPYFGEVGKSTTWLETISKSTQESGLIPVGGLDSHGNSIFYSNK